MKGFPQIEDGRLRAAVVTMNVASARVLSSEDLRLIAQSRELPAHWYPAVGRAMYANGVDPVTVEAAELALAARRRVRA